MPADQVTTQDEEQIHADPAETMDVVGEREAHDARVVDDDNNDGERAEKIDPGLPLAVLEARIDSELSTASLRQEGSCSCGRGLRNGRNLAERAQTLKAFGWARREDGG